MILPEEQGEMSLLLSFCFLSLSFFSPHLSCRQASGVNFQCDVQGFSCVNPITAVN